MDFEGVDIESVLHSVVEDMGKHALKAKAKRYEPKPETEAPAADAAPEAPAGEENGATLSELEAMLNGG